MKNRPYNFVTENCDSSIRIAIEFLFQSFNEKETKSRPISLVNRMQKTIDPAWREYALSFNCDARVSSLLDDFLPGEFAKSNGFFKLEDWCIYAIRDIKKHVFAPQIEILPSLENALAGLLACTPLIEESNLDQLLGNYCRTTLSCTALPLSAT